MCGFKVAVINKGMRKGSAVIDRKVGVQTAQGFL